ncbi:hypothetical protein ACDY97_30725 [Rhizobium mongolense]|uniref:hypothetical protein n=1 Tax=Rhizobium mongolense TaxID=57676 RepID=UPI003557AC1A
MGAQSDCDGDQFLFEDYLHDWDRHFTSRQAVEQLLGSVVPAIHSFYEGNLVMKEHGADTKGISEFYPVTYVMMEIDPGQALSPNMRLTETEPGVNRGDHLTVIYQNPTIRDARWLSAEARRYESFRAEYDSHWLKDRMWKWPTEEGVQKPTVTWGEQPEVSLVAR